MLMGRRSLAPSTMFVITLPSKQHDDAFGGGEENGGL